ncbi:MAG: DUF3368 domain-containing protein [Candidatus Vecturithrix sp.]|jgi:predicted nucleic acid-binding protein|nr:DUF3368 domain-containing protein [Candidatus Vecturithrix sp.]
MPVIISNSSPIIHLAKIGRLNLLQEFYETLTIPKAVYEECLTEGKDRQEVAAIRNADWLKVEPVMNIPLVRLLLSELDKGESEAIVLALEKQADLLLLDDADARDRAKLYHIPITGTLGVLLRAKHEGKIESFGDAFEQIRATGFWVHERLKRRFLTEAGEL